MKLFVVGAARSGTTLMARILGRNPLVYMFKELNFFEGVWRPSASTISLSRLQAVHLVARLMKNAEENFVSPSRHDIYLGEAEQFLETVSPPYEPLQLFGHFLAQGAIEEGKSIACEHTPRNVHYLAEILEGFPDAYVIWMVRDPRAVLCSQKYRWRRSFWKPRYPSQLAAAQAWVFYHPITYSLLWKSSVNRVTAQLPHPRIYKVQFEALVTDPETVIRDLAGKLGLEFTSDMLKVPRASSSHHRDEWEEGGIDQESLDRWRRGCLNTAELFISEKILSQEMARFEYLPTDARLNLLLGGYYLISWLPKAAFSLLLNSARTRGSLQALRRRLAAARSAQRA